jgi:hypothetical protein
MPDTLTIDLDALVENLTLGEVEAIESITGLPVSHAIRKGGMTGTTVLALAYVLERRKDPTYTLEQARSIRFADVDLADAVNNGMPPDPTPAAG